MDPVTLVFIALGAIILLLTVIDGSWADTGWRLLQCGIVFVVAVYVRPHTENMYLAVATGIAVAFVATAVLGGIGPKSRRQ